MRHFSLLRQWSYVHEQRAFKEKWFPINKVTASSPNRDCWLFKTRKKPKSLCLLSFCIICLRGITNSGEKVTLLLNGNRQKLHLSPKCYLCYYSRDGKGMCRLCPCQPGSAKKVRFSLRAREIIRRTLAKSQAQYTQISFFGERSLLSFL